MPSNDDKRSKSGRMGNLFAALVGDSTGLSDEVEVDPATSPATSQTSTASQNVSKLDLEALSKGLARAADPLGFLRSFVTDVRKRDADSSAAAPSAFKCHLADRLEQAGILDQDLKLPRARVVRPTNSDTFYLRIDDEKFPYLAKLRLLRVESALNYALLVDRLLDDANAEGAERIVAAEQRVSRSITGQAGRVALRINGGPAHGDWEVRHALSFGVESFQLPWRFSCRWRLNVAAGAAAFELDLVPPAAWHQTCYVDGLGVVPATPEMRRKAATDYNLRLALLVAGYAFSAAPELAEVWVAGVVDSPAGHACYYSARLPREILEGLDLNAAPDPIAVMKLAGAAITEDGLGLAPVKQAFSLEDERFCPSSRWEDPELSARALGADHGRALGCTHLSDLAVDEACRRKRISTELVRHLGGSTEDNVRAILAVAGEGAQDDVAAAARRCVGLLIDGSLEDDPLAISEAFVDGSDLASGVEKARDAFVGRQDPEEAGRLAREALVPDDIVGTYDDSWPVTWRSFGNYVDRALYNRLLGHAGEDARVAPAAYYEGHMLVSVCALAEGNADEALEHARRAVQLAPLSTQASLHLSHCLEVSGDLQATQDELKRLLSLAHDPEAVGLGYLRMGQLLWQRGNLLAAQACCQRASRFLGTPALVAGIAVVALLGQGDAGMGTMTDEKVDAVLESAGIPLAPTDEVVTAFFEAARAATDAQIWPVARDFLHVLAQMSRDDVYFGMFRSLEDEPDR